jgi:hypothetical protein
MRIQSLLKPTVTVYNYLSFVLPLSDCHHRGDSRKIRQIFSAYFPHRPEPETYDHVISLTRGGGVSAA